MSIDIYFFLLECHLNITCLLVCVISISNMSIQCVIFFVSIQTTCQILEVCLSLDVHIYWFGASFCVSNVQNFCQKYTLA